MTEPAGSAPAGSACVFAGALLAREAACSLSRRRLLGEAGAVDCSWPVARQNCSTLMALLRERSRFALRLPAPGQPLRHALALRLQCGGAAALARLQDPFCEPAPALDALPDIHASLTAAMARHGSLGQLPFADLVRALREWVPPRQRSGQP